MKGIAALADIYCFHSRLCYFMKKSLWREKEYHDILGNVIQDDYYVRPSVALSMPGVEICVSCGCGSCCQEVSYCRHYPRPWYSYVVVHTRSGERQTFYSILVRWIFAKPSEYCRDRCLAENVVRTGFEHMISATCYVGGA